MVFVSPLGTNEDLLRTLEQVLPDTYYMLSFTGHVNQEFIDGINVTQDHSYLLAIAVDFFISHLITVEAWAERTI
jgi:hypothetical protein